MRDRPAKTRLTVAAAVLAATLAAVAAPAPSLGQAADSDGQFEWPLGSTDSDGNLILGHEHHIVQNFYNIDGIYPGRSHAGLDISLRGNYAGAEDSPVYATADGVVVCTSRDGVTPNVDYPGKVVVIQHSLPDGSTVYSQYGHLNYCQNDVNPPCGNAQWCDPNWQSTESPPPCVQPGDRVERGDPIGTITRWRDWDDAQGIWVENPGNSHLHFEIRTFPYWHRTDDEPAWALVEGENIQCPGRGYSLPGTDVLHEGYLDPVEFIYSHRAPFPATTATWSQAERSLREEPSTSAALVTTVPVSSEITVEGAVRDTTYDCLTTDCRADCVGDECHECDWWYRARYVDDLGTEHVGFINALFRGDYSSHLAVGEPERPGDAWVDPLVDPTIEYFFYFDDAADDRLLVNHGAPSGLNGQVEGPLVPAQIQPPFPDEVLAFDGAASLVETLDSDRIDLTGGFRFEVSLRRENNDTDDVIAGQWDPGDASRQSWLLSFLADSPTLPSEAGVLELKVRLQGIADPAVLLLPLATCDYLGEWGVVAGSFHPTDGIRLYRDGRQVAAMPFETRMEIVDGGAPLRIGSATDPAVTTDTDRYDGAFEIFRLWASAAQADAVDAVLIIDSSGSMFWNDPDDQRLSAAKVYLDASLKEDGVALVDFDSAATVLSDLVELTPANKSALSFRIDSIDASGNTDLGQGVQAACNILEGPSATHDKRTAILLTDGVGTFRGYENDCFESHADWTLHAFGFGSADLAQLQTIVAGTGGTAQELPGPEDIACQFQRLRATLAGATPPDCTQTTVQQGETVAFQQTVEPFQAQATFSTSWPGSDVVMTLTSPSGRVIDRNTSAPDVLHRVGATFEVYTITDPEAGVWQVQLFGADVPAGGEPVTLGITTLPSSTPSCEHSGSPGDWSYCTAECPCGERKGDCDTDADCFTGLFCSNNLGASYGWDPEVDVCSADCHDGYNGEWSYCSPECPCDEGQGDCDADVDCLSGLFCSDNVGASYGFDPELDICRTDCHDGYNGEWNYCSPECPCSEGQGDCNADEDCLSGLFCSDNVGASYGFDPEVDICRTDCHDGYNGEWNYCSPECPCDAGQGDCNADEDCLPGLHCAADVGPNYGWPKYMDACEP